MLMSRQRLGSTLGVFLFVFALAALTGPGRIDIVDGQARYEVARSVVDHGDMAIRDPHIWFGRFPGRAGRDYTSYRFPQSLLGVAAIWCADLTSGKAGATEARRHFLFSLTSAVAAAVLACCYLVWFRQRGLSETKSLMWALAGILCTPTWFYATSCFDDVLGAASVLAAVLAASHARGRHDVRAAIAAGLAIGFAFNCKQPLGVFVLPVMAMADEAGLDTRRRLVRAAVVVGGLVAGVLVYVLYDAYKFPPETEAARLALLSRYMPVWPGHPLTALAALAVSPSTGVFWYFPALALAVSGLRAELEARSAFAWAALVSTVLFVGFIVSMSIFKGDPSWGPRYLTPVFALLWLTAPEGFLRLGSRAGTALLAISVAVQVASITIDPHRLYIERGLPSSFGAAGPILYFAPENAHLLNRPREILEVWHDRHEPVEAFTPASAPTVAIPVLDEIPRGRPAIRRYRVFDSFRPWWASQVYLDPSERPVPIGRTLITFSGIGLLGALLWLASFLHLFTAVVAAEDARPLRSAHRAPASSTRNSDPADRGDSSRRPH